MLIIPAIDIYNSMCVRLTTGNFSKITRYSSDPVETAKQFYNSGAKWIHIIDLDAAEGKGRNNRRIIGSIREAVPCRIETGGGIRSENDIKEILKTGIDRLILGTVAVKKPELIAEWVKKYGQIFIAGIDAKDGLVRVSGWQEKTEIQDVLLAQELKSRGIRGIIYTNIAKDGLLTGPDIERTHLIAQKSGLPIVLSGGISSEDDIAEVYSNAETKGIVGVIIGKALYEKRINLDRMIDMYEHGDSSEEQW
ncbi:MAG: 1-(5-phosphoribosyl)-5-[(5-phosphoribosylamino)methylideneamino]imidazole-4-carboxamide isomerase [Spirochaetales bacterium]|nr:1-(5-phosphoribosyl)-5-[(5-phosphoribosylamino)methylideneamino]imidazole-4-carboxamide isomerase [Spirochaetales bacterium]